MIRDDLSNKLVHLVRGDSIEEASRKFESILTEGKLRGGTGYIKGGYRCVCFTETPVSKLGYVLADPERQAMRYRPLGVMVDRETVYRSGGRPVIYQPASDFDSLPEALRYRHVTFDLAPQSGPRVDFTWEREWRLHAEELILNPEGTTVIIPRRDWREVLLDSGYNWHVIVLEDLGIPIPDGLT